jgi:hypothetical protein
MDDNKITIIEGPPPVFEPVADGWALGLNEGPHFTVTVMTRLRTFNGPALVERCYRAWHRKDTIQLHYRNDMGLEEQAPILAARSLDTKDGHMLLLWLYFDRERVEFELDTGDDEDAQDDSD